MAGRPSSNIEAVLSSIEFKHTLHLYSSDVNRYAIQAPFLAAAKEGEAVVYVTNESPATVMKEFEGLDVRLSVIKPEELGGLAATDRVLRMVVDAGSIDPSVLRRMRSRAREAVAKYIDHPKREKYLSESYKECFILCTYDVGELSPDLVKQLVASHDKLVLTTSDTTMLAAESLDRAGLPAESVQRFVKDELESIVLALVLREPMCGTDIIKTIHNKFNVLLSPGTIYPLLHDLEKKGLLKCEYGIKTKTYRPMAGAEQKIRAMLEEHVKASRFLSRFLQVTGVSEKR
jgi:DNA-binding PadR family transcriptional regulator/sulfur relay (sulfurtransferase) DsrF/TusC family protein